MKTVLVWSGYGAVEVYPAETEEDFRKIIDTALLIITDWYVENEDIDYVKKALKYASTDLKYLKKAFSYLAQSSVIANTEAFEIFELVEVKAR